MYEEKHTHGGDIRRDTHTEETEKYTRWNIYTADRGVYTW